jgi:hypothetical protein
MVRIERATQLIDKLRQGRPEGQVSLRSRWGNFFASQLFSLASEYRPFSHEQTRRQQTSAQNYETAVTDVYS